MREFANFLSGSSSTPLGLIFSTFMVCIMLGSSYFSHLLAKERTAQDTLLTATALFAASTGVCALTAGPDSVPVVKVVTFLTFLLLEFAVGLYFPSAGVLRGRLVPESVRATVTNWFRVPMNLITCVTLLAVNHPAVARDKRSVFATCAGLLVTGVLVASKFRNLTYAPPSKKKE